MDISRKAIIWTLLAVAALWAATPIVIGLLPLKDWAERGQVGDLFGSVNALFSGLAFTGVIFAILLQRQELALQRQELKETRAEMKRTADAQDAAQQALNKTIWAQSFKVAVDIVEDSEIVKMRGFLVRFETLYEKPRKGMDPKSGNRI
ncbi:nucleoid DNA-binding protein [Bradyrhizobium sp. LM3.2]